MDVALEFEQEVALCTSDAELYGLLDAVTNELGFKHFALVHSVRLRRDDPKLVSIDNYPQACAEEFVGEALFLDDPMLHASERTAKGFAWTDVGKLFPIQPRHARVLERSARFGMGYGFTVPSNVKGEPSGSCSFATKPDRPLGAKSLRVAELIWTDAFHAARRIHGLADLRKVPHLSRREQQCVAPPLPAQATK
ncbi:MAG TPA: autoinducer binding domain-containing protein [Sphingomicrobium sp.]|nr:autoinducer binding domain-containing protein [Sphingomicrobium sp.]